MKLSAEHRIKILEQELREGAEVWSEMSTIADGKPVTVLACRKWGILLLGDRVLALDAYPLQELKSIETAPSECVDPSLLQSLIAGSGSQSKA
jgi:hypothetical protein